MEITQKRRRRKRDEAEGRKVGEVYNLLCLSWTLGYLDKRECKLAVIQESRMFQESKVQVRGERGHFLLQNGGAAVCSTLDQGKRDQQPRHLSRL